MSQELAVTRRETELESIKLRQKLEEQIKAEMLQKTEASELRRQLDKSSNSYQQQ